MTMSTEPLTCESCGKRDATVRDVDNCGYTEEICPSGPPQPEVICDACEYQHCRDI